MTRAADLFWLAMGLVLLVVIWIAAKRLFSQPYT